jgi:hypothetical protein
MAASVAQPTKIDWLAALNPRYWATPSVAILIAANLLPLVGVLFWGWDLYALMLLYWLETAIVGLFAMVQMAMLAPLLSVFVVPFFLLHFGAFMAVHLIFLVALFGGGMPNRLSQMPDLVWGVLTKHGLWIAIIALFVSHAVSFILNTVRPDWWTRQAGIEVAAPPSKPQQVMEAAYGRVVVMHLTIIFGALLIAVFDTKTAAFVLLIGLKIAVDVAAHVRKNFQPVAIPAA